MSVELQPYISTEIPSLTDALREQIKTRTGQDIPFEVVAAWLSSYVEENKREHFSLSKTRPDFESVKVQFIARVRQTKAWKDVIQAGWGQTMAEFFAAVTDYGQESIMRAYQESGLEARLTSSVYMQMRALGVIIDRVNPAQVPVILWGEGLTNQTIPELSSFTVGADRFFNREPIQFNNNTTRDNAIAVTLYQGEVVVQPCMSRGVPFQYFELGDSDGSISNRDVYCFTASGDEYRMIEDGIWHHVGTDRVFFANLTPSGNLEIMFGNNVHGAIPPVDEVLYMVYANSVGEKANAATRQLSVGLNDLNDVVPHRIRSIQGSSVEEQTSLIVGAVQGESAGSIINGSPLKDRDFYRDVGPSIRASGNRMVNRNDHYANGLRYPGIADVLFQAQKELAPKDRRFTNVIGVTVLTRTGIPLTADEWTEFENYLRSLAIWGRGIEFLRIDPTPRYFDISADVFLTNNSDKTNAGAYLQYAFSQFFRLQRGSIGRSIYGSDIEDLFKFNYGDIRVDYVTDILPSACVDTILGKTEYPVLRSLTPEIKYSGRGNRFQPPRQLY